MDFAVTGRPPENFDVESEVFADHPHIIIAPPDHPLVGRKSVPVARLASETFLLRERGSFTRDLMSRMFAAAGLNPNLGMEIGSNETIKQAVIAGLGIALISAHTVAAEIEDGRLATLNVSGLPKVLQWFVVKRKKTRLLPPAMALWNYFQESRAVLIKRHALAKRSSTGTAPQVSARKKPAKGSDDTLTNSK